MEKETFPLPRRYMQQDEALTEEFKSFISTLPKEKGISSPYLLQYQGFWYNTKFLHGVIYCQKHFQPRDSDIFLASFPKSGTTWLKSIIFTLLNRNLYPVNDTNHPLFLKNPHQLILTLDIDIYGEIQNPNLATLPSPRLFATHMPWEALPDPLKNGSACKIVYVCRDPKDVFVSFWHFLNKIIPLDVESDRMAKVFDSFCNGICAYGPWWNHVLEYWKQGKENPNRILFLKYEDMKEQPGKHIRLLADFLGCSFSVEEEESGLVEEIMKLCSFENLSGLEVNKIGTLSDYGMDNSFYFRQGKIGDWKNLLTDEMAQRIDQIISEQKFGEYGLLP